MNWKKYFKDRQKNEPPNITIGVDISNGREVTIIDESSDFVSPPSELCININGRLTPISEFIRDEIRRQNETSNL